MSDFRREERISGERCEWWTLEKKETRDGYERVVLKWRTSRSGLSEKLWLGRDGRRGAFMVFKKRK
ncbi:hypothetical protein TIFTF001_020177 [Ficus carica]|uniref:Uncharacterized protein n=1 Tax=Ficus carica TaxID=3494 RepID=A0AA88AA93_FICCA|nr:hypothetical protein TIFTF001_020177 [Ficus carica]